MKTISNRKELTDGYYWMIEEDKSPRIVLIRDTAQGLGEFEAMVSFIGTDCDKSLCEVGRCQWLGPINFPDIEFVCETADPEVQFILGRPNFWCGSTAILLRKKGHVINAESEDEQAYVIRWLLSLYKKHGKDWRIECNKYLSNW